MSAQIFSVGTEDNPSIIKEIFLIYHPEKNQINLVISGHFFEPHNYENNEVFWSLPRFLERLGKVEPCVTGAFISLQLLPPPVKEEQYFVDQFFDKYYVIPLSKHNEWEAFKMGKIQGFPLFAEYISDLSKLLFKQPVVTYAAGENNQ